MQFNCQKPIEVGSRASERKIVTNAPPAPTRRPPSPNPPLPVAAASGPPPAVATKPVGRPWWQKKRYILLGTIIGSIFGLAALGSTVETPIADVTPRDTVAPPNPTEQLAENFSDDFDRIDNVEFSEATGVLRAEVFLEAPRSSFERALTGAVSDVIQDVSESDLPFEDFYLQIQMVKLIDILGNVEEHVVLNASWTGETVNAINWDNFESGNILDVGEVTFVHASIRAELDASIASSAPTIASSAPTTTSSAPTTTAVPSVPVTYDVIVAQEIPGTKLSLDVILPTKVTAEQLSAIANELHDSQRGTFDRVFMVYYLPWMEIDAGGWATTHFNPELEVKILGSSLEQDVVNDARIAALPGTILGHWRVQVGLAADVTIYEHEGNTLVEFGYADGSATTNEARLTETSSGTRVDVVDGRFSEETDEHLLIDEDNYLEFRDIDGTYNRGYLVETRSLPT